MTSNSNNMTIAEKLAQKIKSSPFGELIDEDNLTAITEEAIRKAFFDPVVIVGSGGYNTGGTKEPAIVNMARDAFKAHMNVKVESVVAMIAEDPKFVEVVRETSLSLIPDLLMGYGRKIIADAARAGALQAIDAIKERARINMLTSDFGPKDPPQFTGSGPYSPDSEQ